MIDLNCYAVKNTLKILFCILNFFNISISDMIEITAIIISLITSIKAINLTKEQIKLSNKQELFKSRFEIYRLIKKIDELCSNNLMLLDKSDKDDIMAIGLLMNCLTNSVDFYEAILVITNEDNLEYKKRFLTIIEKLKDKGLESQLLFPYNYSDFIYNYFNSYAKLLTKMHQYSKIIDKTYKIRNNSTLSEKEKNDEINKLLHGKMKNDITNEMFEYKDELEQLHNRFKSSIEELEKYMNIAN